MASFAPIRGTQQQIENTPRVDGQFLIETDQGNQNKIYIDTDNGGTVERTMAGGGGHQIIPDIDGTDAPTEASVVEAVNGKYNTPRDNTIISTYGASHWTNTKTFRRIMVGGTPIGSATIGRTGIGTWDDDAEVVEVTPVAGQSPSTLGWYDLDETNNIYKPSTDTEVVENKRYWSTVPDESTWWQDNAFKFSDNSDDINVSIKFDPTGDVCVLGGYMIDNVTGRICIRFANSINPSTARIAVDIINTRNEIG